MQENCGLNIVKENDENKLFFRLPGSDINPYLGVFSIISSVKIIFYY